MRGCHGVCISSPLRDVSWSCWGDTEVWLVTSLCVEGGLYTSWQGDRSQRQAEDCGVLPLALREEHDNLSSGGNHLSY